MHNVSLISSSLIISCLVLKILLSFSREGLYSRSSRCLQIFLVDNLIKKVHQLISVRQKAVELFKTLTASKKVIPLITVMIVIYLVVYQYSCNKNSKVLTAEVDMLAYIRKSQRMTFAVTVSVLTIMLTYIVSTVSI